MKWLFSLLPSLHSDHKRIARGVGLVAILMLAGKLVAAAKEVGVAWRYGISDIVDAYQVATTVVFWIPTVLVSVLTVVLVPMLVRIRNVGQGQTGLFIREMQACILVVGAGLVLFSLAIGLVALPHIAPGLSPHSYELAWRFTLGMAPLIVLTLLMGVYAARLIALENQLNTLLECIPAAVILLFVVFMSTPDVGPLLLGTIFGIVLHAILLSRSAQKADGQPLSLAFTLQSPYWIELKNAGFVLLLGHLIMSIVTPLDQYVAASLGDGAIATLGYANRVIALLIGVGAVAASRGALPVIAAIHHGGQPSRAQEVAIKWAMSMLLFGIAIAGIAWILAPWGMRLLYERGAFTAEDSSLVTAVFRWGLPQIPFYFSSLILVQLLASQGRYSVIALFAVSNLAVKLALNLSLPGWIGLAGINLATSAMLAWSAGCLYYAVIRRQRMGT